MIVENFILDNFKIDETGFGHAGKCLEFSKILVKQFPHLILKKGVVIGSNKKEYTHAWVEDENGNIYDSTRDQFINITPLEYKAFDGEITQQLRCPNCGKMFFNGGIGGLCSENCYTEYIAYLNGN